MGFLKYVKYFVFEAVVKALYSNVIEPQFQHCCSVLNCCDSTDIIQLQRLQSRVVRLVTQNSRVTSGHMTFQVVYFDFLILYFCIQRCENEDGSLWERITTQFAFFDFCAGNRDQIVARARVEAVKVTPISFHSKIIYTG